MRPFPLTTFLWLLSVPAFAVFSLSYHLLGNSYPNRTITHNFRVSFNLWKFCDGRKISFSLETLFNLPFTYKLHVYNSLNRKYECPLSFPQCIVKGFFFLFLKKKWKAYWNGGRWEGTLWCLVIIACLRMDWNSVRLYVRYISVLGRTCNSLWSGSSGGFIKSKSVAVHFKQRSSQIQSWFTIRTERGQITAETAGNQILFEANSKTGQHFFFL